MKSRDDYYKDGIKDRLGKEADTDVYVPSKNKKLTSWYLSSGVFSA